MLQYWDLWISKSWHRWAIPQGEWLGGTEALHNLKRKRGPKTEPRSYECWYMEPWYTKMIFVVTTDTVSQVMIKSAARDATMHNNGGQLPQAAGICQHYICHIWWKWQLHLLAITSNGSFKRLGNLYLNSVMKLEAFSLTNIQKTNNLNWTNFVKASRIKAR